MNAPAIAPEIQQEAARSLLERLSEKTALVRFFRYNASAKHGVPIDVPNTIAIGSTRTDTTKTDTTKTDISQHTTDGSDQKQPSQQTNQQPGQQVSQQPGQSGQQSGQAQPNISVNLSQPQAQSNGNDYLKGALLTLATLAGLGGAIAIGYMIAGSPDPAPPPAQVQQPLDPMITQSPLQFLEDIGAHLP